MGEETLFSYEESGTRQEVAASLRAVAARLSGTGPLTLAAGDEAFTVHPSGAIDFEVEVERDDEDDEGYVELEFELGWSETGPIEGDEPIETVETDDDSDETGGADDDRATVDLAAMGAPDEDAEGRPDLVGSQATFEVFRDRADEWRWRLVHRNGNVVATSGEGYTRRRNAENGIRSVVENAPEADVVDGL